MSTTTATLSQADIDRRNASARDEARRAAAREVTPLVSAWTHPVTGETRYYINNVATIAGMSRSSERGRTYVLNGEVFSDYKHNVQSAIQACVDAHPALFGMEA